MTPAEVAALVARCEAMYPGKVVRILYGGVVVWDRVKDGLPGV